MVNEFTPLSEAPEPVTGRFEKFDMTLISKRPLLNAYELTQAFPESRSSPPSSPYRKRCDMSSAFNSATGESSRRRPDFDDPREVPTWHELSFRNDSACWSIALGRR